MERRTVVRSKLVENRGPTVVLEMDVKEFMGLLAMHNAHGGGEPDGLRGRIEQGLEDAKERLPMPWAAVVEAVNEAVSSGNSTYIYDQVDEVWGNYAF